MARGWRDHFVPQLLIKRFTNEKGRVFCFDKKLRRVPDRERGNKPRDVLYKSRYYVDQVGDLDAELYKPIEDQFGPHLSALLEDTKAGLQRPGLVHSLNEWVAAQVSRTQFAEQILKIYGRRFGSEDLLKDLQHRRGALGSLRVGLFEETLQQLRGLRWHAYSARADERRQFVLSDEAVIETPPAWATGTMFLAPLSPRLMVAAGTDRGHMALKDPRRNILPMGLNGVAMSYAYRFVYAPRLLELESLASMFDLSGDQQHDSWMRHASLPHFGLDLMLDEVSEQELRQYFLDPRSVDEFLRRRSRDRQARP